MFNVEEGLTDGWVDALNLIDTEMPYRKEDFYNSIKQESLAQHNWWYNEVLALNINVEKSNVYAPGYGVYNVPLLRRLGAKVVRMYDYDQQIQEINWRVNKFDAQLITYEHYVMDVIFDHDWVNKDADFVLNTSCEVMYHFHKIKKQYSHDTVFCLQGTNKPKKGNINLPQTLDEFIITTGITDIYFEGVLPDNGWERYMVIGR
jgi:hypothetical protein